MDLGPLLLCSIHRGDLAEGPLLISFIIYGGFSGKGPLFLSSIHRGDFVEGPLFLSIILKMFLNISRD